MFATLTTLRVRQHAVGLRVAFAAAALVFTSSTLATDGKSLSLDEALRVGIERSPALAAQRSAVSAAEQSTVSARELPDPKLIFGVDNLPIDGPDRYSVGRDFMTMRKIGVMQEFPRAEKRELKGERAAKELEPRVRFAKLNVDEEPAIAARYGIRGIPTLIVFDRGKIARQQTGLVDINFLRSLVTTPAV